MKQFALPGAKWHDYVQLTAPYQNACYWTEEVATNVKQESQCRENEPCPSPAGTEGKSTNLKWLQINPQVIMKETAQKRK